MQMSEYAIKTTKLTKRFGEQIGVDRVNMHVPQGKIYGLLGRNGAGKTTTMRMLLNLAAPTSGEISLFGEDYRKNLKGTYRRIGSMIETPGFYENLTGRENLQIFARLRGQHKKDSVQNALEIVGLDKEKKKNFGNYSLGMKQRLGIAAAIMHEPEVLILDEPINGLDPVGIQEVRKYLEKLCIDKGVTILISSHILSEIEQLADIIGVMHEGRLIEEVAMQELHQRNRQYVEFMVSDENKACLLLEQKFGLTDYSVHEKGSIRLYTNLEMRSMLNQCFVESDISVSKVNISEEKLEDYFSNLIGGGKLG
jgi:ABC-type multidrug transport system ATPase subunit